jgi:hypothetical protein
VAERNAVTKIPYAGKDKFVLFVEDETKWYRLYLRGPNGVVTTIQMSELETYCKSDESPFCDHVPNPMPVQRMCRHFGWEIDERSLEVMIGRWELEVRNNYQLEEA